ncbi:MAG: undecaprenyl-diphosphatase UppP [Bacteroidetes bacterium]|nr:undecaprenyl-diphosphatase UppP [Bacteroidota bacterium]
MNIFEAILLGIIQGLTEFLPISSTGHLTVVGKLLHLISDQHPEEWTAFIAVIQLGTVIAVVIYFWKDIWEIIFDFINQNLKQRVKFSDQKLNSKLGWLIIAGSIPVGVIGLSLKKIIEGTLTKDLYVIAFSLIGLAIILAIAEKTAKLKKEMKDITKWDAFWVGVAQCFALIPGSSRSGTTITGGLFLGMNRETAARFSFLLSIPAVLASGLLELYEARKFLNHDMAVHMALATIFAFIFGYLSIDLLLKYLRKNTTFVFVYYRIALGIIILVLLSSHVILP